MKRSKKIVAAVMAMILISSQMILTVAAAGGKTPRMSGGGIVIDGHYDDWNNVPKTIIEWGNMDGKAVNHEGALLFGGDMLYVYFGLNEKYITDILRKGSNYLKVNGQQRGLRVLPVTPGGDRLESDDDKDLPGGIHTQYAVYIEDWSNGGWTKIGTDVAYTVYKDGSGKRKMGDCLEFSIEVDKLAKVLNMKPDQIREISIQNTFLGGWVSMVGGSTYALLFFMMALPIVIAGFYRYSKNKKGMA